MDVLHYTKYIIILYLCDETSRICWINKQKIFLKAVSQNKIDVVKLLLTFGANPHLLDKHSRLPANYTTDPSILSLLSQSNSLVNQRK